MKESATITIEINKIRDIFEEDCEEDGEKFTEKNFQSFLQFLEIDLYDWVKGNLRYFYQQKQK